MNQKPANPKQHVTNPRIVHEIRDRHAKVARAERHEAKRAAAAARRARDAELEMGEGGAQATDGL